MPRVIAAAMSISLLPAVHRRKRIGDRRIGDARELAQQRDLVRRLDLARAREERLGRAERAPSAEPAAASRSRPPAGSPSRCRCAPLAAPCRTGASRGTSSRCRSNSPQTRISSPGRRLRTVVSSMSTDTTACVPSALTTTIAWRQRRIGCDGNDETRGPGEVLRRDGDERVQAVVGHERRHRSRTPPWG